MQELKLTQEMKSCSKALGYLTHQVESLSKLIKEKKTKEDYKCALLEAYDIATKVKEIKKNVKKNLPKEKKPAKDED